MNAEDIYSTHSPPSGAAGVYHVNRKAGEIRNPGPSSAMVFVEEAQFSIDDGMFGFHPADSPGERRLISG